jgi:hypothetical protein
MVRRSAGESSLLDLPSKRGNSFFGFTIRSFVFPESFFFPPYLSELERYWEGRNRLDYPGKGSRADLWEPVARDQD